MDAIDPGLMANFMAGYVARGQHGGDRAMTRYRHDLSKMVENNEISTGPGRYVLGVPHRYANAGYVANPTVLNQRWGASHDMTSTKTDVESDLRNIGRPSTRVACGQYVPGTDAQRPLTNMPDVEFPHTYERLVDPPCTLRGSGWNRWEWLCQNPQENVITPFEHLVNTQQSHRDGIYSSLNRGVTAVTTSSTPLICGSPYVEDAVPVARPQPVGAPANFSDAVPGASQRVGVMPAQERPRGLVPQRGGGSQHGPLREHPQIPEGQALERLRAERGILAPPAPFTEYMAPH